MSRTKYTVREIVAKFAPVECDALVSVDNHLYEIKKGCWDEELKVFGTWVETNRFDDSKEVKIIINGIEYEVHEVITVEGFHLTYYTSDLTMHKGLYRYFFVAV